jgi:transposase
MKAYSLDFREKIIDVYFTEGLSVRKLAKQFGVAKSFIETLLKRLRETGDILPKPHGGGPQPKLNAEQLKLVKALVEADNDATLDELRERLASETSISISRSTMGRMVQKLNLTRKKKRCTPAKQRVPAYSNAESSTGSPSGTSPQKI